MSGRVLKAAAGVLSLLIVLAASTGVLEASGSTWYNSIGTPQTTVTFYQEDCDESGCLYIPYQYTFNGNMYETWNGIQEGYAYLVTDKGSSEVYWPSGSPIVVEGLWTAAYYYDTANSDSWEVSGGSEAQAFCGWPSGDYGECNAYTDTLDTLQDYPDSSAQYWTEITMDCSGNDVTPCGAETPIVDAR